MLFPGPAMRMASMNSSEVALPTACKSAPKLLLQSAPRLRQRRSIFSAGGRLGGRPGRSVSARAPVSARACARCACVRFLRVSVIFCFRVHTKAPLT